MKKFISGLLVGALVTMSIPVFAQTQMSIDAIFGKVKLVVNNTPVQEETLLYDGVTYVPLRAISEMLNKEVTYDNSTYTAYINDNQNSADNVKNSAKALLLKMSIGLQNTIMEAFAEGMTHMRENPELAIEIFNEVKKSSQQIKEIDSAYFSDDVFINLNSFADSMIMASDSAIAMSQANIFNDIDVAKSKFEEIKQYIKKATDYRDDLVRMHNDILEKY